MSNINLSQSGREEGSSSQKSKIIDKGTFISLAILILTLLAFGGIKMYNKILDDKITAVKNQTSAEIKEIKSEEVNRVADFQNRIDKIKSNIDSKNNPNSALDSVGKAMIAGAYLNSYGYNSTENTLSLSVSVNGFEDMARQILGFKKQFGNASVTSSSRSEDGKVQFGVTISSAK